MFGTYLYYTIIHLPEIQICMGYTYTKELLTVYLKFTVNWVTSILSDNPRLS